MRAMQIPDARSMPGSLKFPAVNEVVIRDARGGCWQHFSNPLEILIAKDINEVVPCLQRIESIILEKRLYAAGFIAYEASPAFDPAYQTCPPSFFPLLWFGIYEEPDPIVLPKPQTCREPDETKWTPSVTVLEYNKAITNIKKHIAYGDTYQVNYTIRQHAQLQTEPWQFFLKMARNAPYGAFIETDEYAICSASPELFFHWNDRQVTSRPMKGTAPRGCTTKEDLEIACRLRHSEKNRAENVMIVDMIRNDLGRLAVPNSVRVDRLFETEKYPTVWQLTSTVTAKTDASLSEIMKALFPCASITGAPKVKTMSIIADLEDSPRNVYTGCIGFITPDQNAQFSVAIRTMLIDKSCGQAEYGVGGGIVWDSSADEEYEECVIKTKILNSPQESGSFFLLETMLWTPNEHYFLMPYHFERLADSANYFGYCCDLDRVEKKLAALVQRFENQEYKVRLLVSKNGDVNCQYEPFIRPDVPAPVRVKVASTPVNRNNPFLYHKTTNRAVYQAARAAFRDDECDDVLLWNEGGYVTETCIANVIVRIDGEWVTPPVECGLLNGTYRTWLLSEKKIVEKKIALNELSHDTEVYLINSVRKWQKARIIFPD